MKHDTAAGDREAFFKDLRQKILKSARRRLNEDDAQDVTQETMVVLLSKYAEVPDHELVFLMFPTLTNKIYERWRQKARYTSLDGETESEDGGVTLRDGKRNLEEEEAIRAIALAELLSHAPADCRKLIALRGEGKSHEEIRVELGLPSANAVAARLSRCLTELTSRRTMAAQGGGALKENE